MRCIATSDPVCMSLFSAIVFCLYGNHPDFYAKPVKNTRTRSSYVTGYKPAQGWSLLFYPFFCGNHPVSISERGCFHRSLPASAKWFPPLITRSGAAGRGGGRRHLGTSRADVNSRGGADRPLACLSVRLRACWRYGYDSGAASVWLRECPGQDNSVPIELLSKLLR